MAFPVLGSRVRVRVEPRPQSLGPRACVWLGAFGQKKRFLTQKVLLLMDMQRIDLPFRCSDVLGKHESVAPAEAPGTPQSL